jgi:hypothetical protein
MKLDGISTDLAREEDADKILEINRLEYGADDVLATRTDFVWRYARNPAGQAIVPVIRDEHNDVIGFIWIVPMRIRVKAQDYLVATGTNLVIHPKYRDTFAYTKLIRRFQEALKDNDVPLHFSFVSEETFRRRREQDPRTVSTISFLLKPLDFDALSRTYLAAGWQRFALSWAGRIASPFLFRRRLSASSGQVSVRTAAEFDEGFDQFWYSVRDKYPLMVIRDRAFLSWRFASVSGRQYQVLMAWSHDQMLGYAVLGSATVRGVKTGLIMDLLIADGPLAGAASVGLLAEAETTFRSQGMSLAGGLVPSFASEYRAMRRAAYADLPQAFMPRAFRFAYFLHSSVQRDLISLAAQDWFVTLADYESF